MQHKYRIFINSENVEKLQKMVDNEKNEDFSDVINRLIKKAKK